MSRRAQSTSPHRRGCLRALATSFRDPLRPDGMLRFRKTQSIRLSNERLHRWSGTSASPPSQRLPSCLKTLPLHSRARSTKVLREFSDLATEPSFAAARLTNQRFIETLGEILTSRHAPKITTL